MATRTSNSIRNIEYGVVFQFLFMLIQFVVRRVFVSTLSQECLGINGTFSNIISMLSIAELGVGGAITFSLYEPLAKGDSRQVAALMNFYRRFCNILGLVLLAVGGMITFFLSSIIKNMPDIPHLKLIYLLFVVDSSFTYFLGYRQLLITADQKERIVTVWRYGILIVASLLQMGVLLLFQDFLLYIVLKLCSTVAYTGILYIRCGQLYPQVIRDRSARLSAEGLASVAKNTRATFLHRIGSVVVYCTDNLVLAHYTGVVEVGIYSNYLLITNGLRTVYDTFFRGLNASIGNLGVMESQEAVYQAFRRINHVTKWLYGFSALAFFVLSKPFITLWVGEVNLFSSDVVLLLALNFYVSGMRNAVSSFKDSLGLFWNDRYKSIAEAVVNLAVSIVLVKRIGLVGVFWGTLISALGVGVWVEVRVLFRHGLRQPRLSYWLDYCLNSAFFFAVGALCWWICESLPLHGVALLFVDALVVLLIPNALYLLFFGRKPEMAFFIDLLVNKFLRKLKRAK